MRGHTVCTPVSSSDVTPSYMKREKHFAAPCNNNSLEDEGGKGDESGRTDGARERGSTNRQFVSLSQFLLLLLSQGGNENGRSGRGVSVFLSLSLSLSLRSE